MKEYQWLQNLTVLEGSMNGRGEMILTYGFIWTSTIELSSMITNGYIWETDLIWTFLFEKSDPNKSETVTIITRNRTELNFFPRLSVLML